MTGAAEPLPEVPIVAESGCKDYSWTIRALARKRPSDHTDDLTFLPARAARRPRYRSKTDQEGHDVTIAIARGVTACPVKAVKAWLQAAGISEGPIFRPVARPQRLKVRGRVRHRAGPCAGSRLAS
jgi:hypothetical protein